MALNLPDNAAPGDDQHSVDHNLIVDAIKALEQRAPIPGAQGPQGPVGPDGPVGPVGPQGVDGVRGPEGPAGPQGVAGGQGPIGPQGDPGVPGPQGPAGAAGVKGDTGDPGAGVLVKGEVANAAALPAGAAINDAYVTLDTGHMHVWNGASWTDVGQFSGPAGPAGAAGAAGAQGPKGDTGAVGPAGPTGPKGDTGAAGADSTVAGPVGPTGPAGAKGDKGDKGDPGAAASGSMIYKGDYMPVAYAVGDSVRWDGGLFVCVAAEPGGAPAPVTPRWERVTEKAPASAAGGMVWKGDYMPVAYEVGDTVTHGRDLWVCVNAVAAGGSAPTAPDWQKAVNVPATPALDDITDVVLTSPSDKQALLWDQATGKWVNGTVATTPPDLTPYALKAGAAFTGTVTAPGLAPDAGKSVRNTFFLTAAPPDTLGSDGDIAIVIQ